MRKVKLFFTMLMLIAFSVGNVWAAEETYTFTDVSTPTTATTDGFTFTFDKGSGSTAPAWNAGSSEARLYAKGSLTIDGGENTITSIVFTYVVNKNKSGKAPTISSVSGTSNSGTWVESSKTWSDAIGDNVIVFSTSGEAGNIGFKSVTITYSTGGGEKTDVTDEQLAWSEASKTVTFGDEPYSLPTLTNTISVSVSYQSTDETVATISNTGVVSILKSGSTTIKAIFAGDATYNAKTVSYTLTVSPAPLTPIAGGIVDELVISDFGVTSGYTAFSNKQASNTGHSDAVYAGKANRGGNSTQYNIQLNTIGTGTSAGRGIVTTTSGGNAKRVQAIWGTTGTGNTDARYLTVYGANSAYTGSETTTSGTNLGTITFHTGDEYAYLDIVGDYPYIMIVASGAMYIDQINITWLPKDESKVATPSIDGTDNFYPSTNVTITCGTDDADIYYTTDGTTPSALSTKYTGVFSVNKTTTVKAIAIKEGLTDSEEAEATFTKITPLTVAQALVEATGSGKYVTGTITSITEVSIANGNATYVISDISAGVKQNEMIVYRGKYVGGADFTSADQIHVGDVVVVSGSISQYKSVNQMAQGNQIETISAPAVAAPVFDPNGGGFVVSTDVTITCATGSSTIYYTLDETNPSKSSSVYSSPIHLDATKTIKAIAYVGDESSLVVEKTFTLTAPMTVAEACAALDSEDPINNAAVSGIVYQVDHCTAGGNATYWISDDGTNAGDVLEVFNGYGLNGAAFVENGIRVGDEVVVFGNLTIFSTSTYEFSAGSRILSLERKTVESVAVTGTPTKTNYKVGDAFDPAGLTVTVTYDDASHATVAVADCSWEKDPATFDAAGTGLSVSVKATYAGVQSPAFAVEGLSVKAIPTFDDPNYEWQLVTSNAQLEAGKYYVIGSASAGKTANKTITSGYLGTVASTIADGVIAYDELGANTAIFELGGESGAWTLVEAIEEKQLTGATTANFAWDGATNTTWPISIDGENAIIGASNGYRVLYNVNSPRFKPYNSATSASMVLPQLYVWALKTYKLRYDANGGEDAPAAQPAVAGQATVTDAEPTYTDHIFNGWNTLVGGDGEAKAAGDVIDLSSGDVTLYAQWRSPFTVTVSYDANGGDGTMDADANQVEGSLYTIKANEFTREGYNFTGWKAYDANDVELTITNGKFIVPATNVTVKAQWGEWTATEFVLVTDKAQLKDGDKVYIVAAGYERAMGTQNTNYRNEVAIHKAGSSISVMEGAEPVEFTLGKSGDNFTFNDGTGYLYAAGTANSGKNYINTKDEYDAACDWTITIDESGTEIKSVENDKTPFMQYNPGSTRFSCYNTASQQAVVLYKKADYTRAATEGRYGTICLPQAGQIIGATLYEVADKDDSKIYFDEILNGQMEAGKPYIFLPNSGESQLAVLYTSDVVETAKSVNGLVGFIGANADAEMDVPVDAYILSNNQYRLVEHAGSAKIKSYHSYINLGGISSSMPAPGRRRISMSYFGSQVATGIENAEANEAPRKVLINGEMFIIRGGKMYDAKGQLVK